MFKLVVLFFIILLLMNIVLEATDVWGNQSGVWTVNDSPYNVIGNIVVPVGESLLIEPGVHIEILGDYRFTVQGTIEAIGTETDSIRFFATGLRWDLIRLENETLESTFTHCVISNADTGINSILSPVTISHCRFDDNITGIRVFGIGAADPPPVNILHTKIENSQQNGIFIVQNSNTLISGCEITASALNNQPRGAIQLSNQSAGGHNNPTIINNHIHNNVWQGLTAWDLTGTSSINPLVENNLIEYNLTGIYLIHSSGNFNNNVISNNFVTGNPDSGAGVMISGASAMPVFKENIFTGNFTGFYLINNGSANLGDLTTGTPQEVGMNQIHNNIGPDGNLNSIYNMSSADIMAQNNIWDSEDYDVIADTIYDGNDNPQSGFVIFDPIYQPSEATISGSIDYWGEIELEFIRIVLYDRVNNSILGETAVDISEQFILTISDFGEFYLYAYGIPIFENELKPFGAYGGLTEPVLIEIDPNDELTGIDLEVLDQSEPLYLRIEEIYQENSTVLYGLEKSHFVFPVDKKALLYEDEDYVRLWAYLVYNPQTGEVDSLFVDQDAAYSKLYNLQIGDTWVFPYYNEQLAEIVYLNAEVVSFEEYEFQGTMLSAYRISFHEPSENQLLMVWWIVEDIGVVRKQIYEDFALLRDYRLTEHQVYGGSGFFPLALENSWSFSGEFPQLAPSELRFFIENDNLVRLLWEAPRQNQASNWEGYRIYRNGIEEYSIGFLEPGHTIPLPGENSLVLVTAFNIEGESSPTNEVEIIVSGIEGNQLPVTPKAGLRFYPNPIGSSGSRSRNFTVSVFLPESQEIDLALYNIKGQRAVTLYRGFLSEGVHDMHHNLSSNHNRNLGKGIYFLRLHYRDGVIVRKSAILH